MDLPKRSALLKLIPSLYFYLLACILYAEYAVAPVIRALSESEAWSLSLIGSLPLLLFSILSLVLEGFLIYYPAALVRAARRGSDAWWKTPVMSAKSGSVMVAVWFVWLALAHVIGLA